MVPDFKNINLRDWDIRNVYEWPIYGRIIIFCLICITVFYLGYFFYFSRLSNQIYSNYKQELDLKQQIKAIIKTEEEMKSVVLPFPEVLKLVNEWQGQLISSDHLPDLLNQILKVGAANHLVFSLFAPGTKEQEGDYFKVPIKIVIHGGYNQVAHFISQVANMPSLVAVGDFVMVKSSNEAGIAGKVEGESVVNSLTTALTLEVYYLANKK